MFESGLVTCQVVRQKLTEIDKTGWRKITSSRAAASIFRNVLHPHRRFTKMHLVVTGECSAEKPRVMRHHVSQLYIESPTIVQFKKQPDKSRLESAAMQPGHGLHRSCRFR